MEDGLREVLDILEDFTSNKHDNQPKSLEITRSQAQLLTTIIRKAIAKPYKEVAYKNRHVGIRRDFLCINCGMSVDNYYCSNCGQRIMWDIEKPYSREDYMSAKFLGLDLDDWNDYQKYYGLGEEDDYN